MIVAIIIGSFWLFIIAVLLGFENVEGILNSIGIFWIIFFVITFARAFIKPYDEDVEYADEIIMKNNSYSKAIENLKQFNKEQPQYFDSGKKDIDRALGIIESLPWERQSIIGKGRVQYCVTQKNVPNASEFQWLLGYISDNGTPENPNNPCSYVITRLNGTEYKTIRSNKYFKSDVLYKFGEESDEQTVQVMNCLDAHNKS